jgi:hypothetical protein
VFCFTYCCCDVAIKVVAAIIFMFVICFVLVILSCCVTAINISCECFECEAVTEERGHKKKIKN